MTGNAIIGITGDLTLPAGFTIGVKRATFRALLGRVDTTTTQDAGNRRVLGGVRAATGTAVGIPKTGSSTFEPGFLAWQSTSAATVPAAFVFKVNGATCQYSMTVLIYDISIAFDYAGAAVLSFSWDSDGPITPAWG